MKQKRWRIFLYRFLCRSRAMSRVDVFLGLGFILKGKQDAASYLQIPTGKQGEKLTGRKLKTTLGTANDHLLA